MIIYKNHNPDIEGNECETPKDIPFIPRPLVTVTSFQEYVLSFVAGIRFKFSKPHVKERTFRFVWQCPFLLLRVIYCCYLREGERKKKEKMAASLAEREEGEEEVWERQEGGM